MEICCCGGGKDADGNPIDIISEPSSKPYRCRKCKLPRSPVRPSDPSCQCYDGRNEPVTAHVSKKAKTAVKESDISAGQIVEAVVAAAEERGLTIPQVIALLSGLEQAEQPKDAA
jgi:hypothetical protein